MDKKSLIIIGSIIALIAGSVVYVLASNNTDSHNMTTGSTTQTESSATPTEPAIASSDRSALGAYVDYSADAVSTTPGTKILFFHASWCPQCRSLESSINASKLPDNLTIFKVDYDSNQALRQQYGVTLQTTLVKVDDDGNKVDSYVAYDDPTFASVQRELLP